MPSKRKSKSTTANDGSWHEVECNGPDRGYGGCVAWTSLWFPRKIPKNFLSRPFLCGFCAAEAIERLKLAGDDVANYSQRSFVQIWNGVIQELFVFRNNIRWSGREWSFFGNFFFSKGIFWMGIGNACWTPDRVLYTVFTSVSLL